MSLDPYNVVTNISNTTVAINEIPTNLVLVQTQEFSPSLEVANNMEIGEIPRLPKGIDPTWILPLGRKRFMKMEDKTYEEQLEVVQEI